MKPTAKFGTLILNVAKWQKIHKIVRAYAQEKDHTLVILGRK